MKLSFATENEMIDFSKSFFNPFPIGKILGLCGNMGTGKTTFLKGLAFRLGISYFTSPTYNIVNVYEFIDFKFYHIDLYRLNILDEFELVGGMDILLDKVSIIAIEWPEIIIDVLPKDRLILLKFEIEDTKRILEF
ncbi:tRNA (adenosine(37)-N6)-threonylcarbamoyltransferase complex ATPase subunit type 1 TsaE [Borrelia miyamotoi]|uniref:tRNA threonylcarbamoyladenosine biosynthesis protein TsaE n=1 Tax=Borrelia miyamotoi TaxID=47466 RepID=A0AAX3JM77_9SPIR|nr:tRNA (adenosine(37)-N6)-threonylcarbamoyltransferase complex ATPase subunit type 1 TsaE [Borrelia miyamotoi]QFP42125.1 tRNA (adenosine(37)-N6)-threonylcarbamoyltransferase complex ATPase subunit type 1 TsaE [Borrelia miyamotoi]QFP48240.1 tRNA (adenosine(37)-N6)-threonylcarbamoyltransferase complex ATPase subunit type 1 TsaE [Borrelia miyamotoi]QGT55999.1 tRNA (adenosine(37)-N6)-threonylcarbamoyltransferase complex ATPase subunit type 1 TsaE [Borrelia miyamotoi]QGT56780.1 tRNA (adenosine(37)-